MVTSNSTNSEKIFERAKKVIPGGVNSPVRAFQSVNMTPRFISRADKAYIYDEDGNKYIDYIGSWGPMILGHNNPQIKESVIKACENGLSFGAATEIETKMAELICSIVPSIEMIRMVNSGTEAVMSAIRAARGFTQRNKIIKFTGCYHGHSDAMLIKAGSGVMTAGVPDSSGVPCGCTEDTISAKYNDLKELTEIFERYENEIAAVIIEPVAANMGVVLPKQGFLEGVRALCDKYKTILIFDEVITGFRLGLTGAQGYFNIKPDLTTFGKIIGAGMPVGAYGGRKDIMEMVAPVGNVYQAGTLSGNPVAMAAGYTQLNILKDNPNIYKSLNENSDTLFNEMKKIFDKKGISCKINHAGSLGCIYFSENEIYDYDMAKTSDTKAFALYFKHMINNGIYIAPSQFEAMFVSFAHNKEEIEQTLAVIEAFKMN